MRTKCPPIQRLLWISVISAMSILLSACNTIGNVVPQQGPTMEQVYDSMGKVHDVPHDAQHDMDSVDPDDLNNVRTHISTTRISSGNILPVSSGNLRAFRQLPNPSLRLYIFPHFAGSEQSPVPGYTTALNVYDHAYYALPGEVEG